VPGAAARDDKPDEELRALPTVADADYDALWSHLVEQRRTKTHKRHRQLSVTVV
jgi:hypothetical protein